jgi:beta-lactam-binding protein with PASTA domain
VIVFLTARQEAEPPRGTPGPPPATAATSEAIVMPDLRGMTYIEALSWLEGAGLVQARRIQAQGEPGMVVATDPSMGQLVEPGTAVTIFVGAEAPGVDEQTLVSL